jgi:hypothetical protein
MLFLYQSNSRPWEGGRFGIALFSLTPILETRIFHFYDPQNYTVQFKC